MPELPEVETIKRDLNKKIRGKQIAEIITDTPKMFTPRFSLARKKLIGGKIKDVERRAKLLIIKINKDLFLLIHLKMTGQLVYSPKKGKIVVGGHPITGVRDLPNKFTHVSFYFKDDSVLYFNDVRKFGYMKLVDRGDLEKILEDFGIEPLSGQFSLEKFKQILKKRKKSKIKQVLMDQKLLAGIGNIYADESLFAAGIRPMRRAGKISDKEAKKLYENIKKILKKAIERRGTSFSNYVDSEGKKGNFVPLLKVYGRGGEKCKKCGHVLKKTKVGGRGTVYCSFCQK